jgi:hypothetical protein
VEIDCDGQATVLAATDGVGVGDGGSFTLSSLTFLNCNGFALSFAGPDVDFTMNQLNFSSVDGALSLVQAVGGRAASLTLDNVSVSLATDSAFVLQYVTDVIATDVTMNDVSSSGIYFVNNDGEAGAAASISLTRTSCTAVGSVEADHGCVFGRYISTVGWSGGSVSNVVGAGLFVDSLVTATVQDLSVSDVEGMGGIVLHRVTGDVLVDRTTVSDITCTEWNCGGISSMYSVDLTSLTVRDSTVDLVDARNKWGGGIVVDGDRSDAAVLLDNVTVTDCRASGGAGIAVRGVGSFTMTGGRVDDNIASLDLSPETGGGGLFLDECGVVLVDGTSFSRNAAHFGSAIDVWGFYSFGTIHESITVRHVTVVNSTCLSEGEWSPCSGAVDLGRANDILLEHVTVSGSYNATHSQTAGFSLSPRRSLIVRDSSVVDSSAFGPVGIQVYDDQIDELDGVGAPAPPFSLLLERVTFERLLSGDSVGAGALYDQTNATLRQVTVRDCSAVSDVGGLLVHGRVGLESTLLVDSSTFDNNFALGDAGGLAIDVVGTSTVANSVFTSNRATGSGAGMTVEGTDVTDASLTLRNCTFANNLANDSGGALIALTLASLSDEGSTFTSNIALLNGGALDIYNVHALSLSNDRFEDCVAVDGSGGAVAMWGVDGWERHVSTWSSVQVYNGGANEGGAAFYTGEYNLTASQLLVRGNTAFSDGGAFSFAGGSENAVTFTRSTLLDNTAGWRGGALYLVPTPITLTINRSNFLRNGQSLLRRSSSSAPLVGQDIAVASSDVTLTVTDSVLDGATEGVPDFFEQVGAPLHPFANRPSSTGPIFLAFSTSSDRSSPQPLDNATVTPEDFVFLQGHTDLPGSTAVRSVVFYSVRAGLVFEDNLAPWDLGGGSVSTASDASDILAPGYHVIFALCILSNGTIVVPRADFRVGATSTGDPYPSSPSVASRLYLEGIVDATLSSSCVCAGPDATWTSYAVECDSPAQSLHVDGPSRFAALSADCSLSFGPSLAVTGCDATSGCQLGDFALASVPQHLVPATPAPPTPGPPTPSPPTPAPPTPAPPLDGSNSTTGATPTSTPAGRDVTPSAGGGSASVDAPQSDGSAGLIAALIVLALLTIIVCVGAGLLLRRLLSDAAVRRDTIARPALAPSLAPDVEMEDIDGGSFRGSSSGRSRRQGHSQSGGGSGSGGSEYARIADSDLGHSEADSSGYVRVGAPEGGGGGLPGTGALSNYDAVSMPLAGDAAAAAGYSRAPPPGDEATPGSEYSAAPPASDHSSRDRSDYAEAPPPKN